MTTKVAAIRCACKLDQGNPAPARHELPAAAAAVGTRLQMPLMMISRNMELNFRFMHYVDTMNCCISQCHMMHPVTIELSLSHCNVVKIHTICRHMQANNKSQSASCTGI